MVVAPQFDKIIQTHQISEIHSCLKQIEDYAQNHYWAFGYISYEAAGAFGLPTKTPASEMPLLWFGLCKNENVQIQNTEVEGEIPRINGLQFQTSQDQFNKNIASIREHIARGDTYQVNYTLRANVLCQSLPMLLFHHLIGSQPVPYAALLQTESGSVISLSPELFLQRQGTGIYTRPMKGTIARGRWLEEDRHQVERLRNSRKDQAENVMITDMARNDLGRICRYGTVETTRLFFVERYQTLFQFTSTVYGELKSAITLPQIFQAAFPAASITGAPKHRTMEIIRDHEDSPREVYCGSIGMIQPGGDFVFNVAIRTLWGSSGHYKLGLGGGIVWDSKAENEYEEVKTKSNFLFTTSKNFTIFETMLLNEQREYLWLNEHLKRMQNSAEYWDFSFNRSEAMGYLEQYKNEIETIPKAVKIELESNGYFHLSHRDVTQIPNVVNVCISERRTHSKDPLIFHKISQRDLYNNELKWARQQGYFEVLFCNEQGNVTEGSITNVFYRIGEQWYTPPIVDGLLAGVWRMHEIKKRHAIEKSIQFYDILEADEVRIGNSVLKGIVVDKLIHLGGNKDGASTNHCRN